MKVYLCGPMAGLTHVEAAAWRQAVRKALPTAECLNPLRGKGRVLKSKQRFNPEGESALLCRPSEILARDSNDVRNCDVILANFLSATDVSIGSIMEIAWGWLLGKYVVVLMEKDNPHQHSFVEACASVIVDNWDDALFCVRSYVER